MKHWKILDSRLLVDKRWLRLHEQRVGLPNGSVIDEFHKFETPDWVAVIALTPERQVVVVEQYRHGLGRTSRELPAGVIDPGESPEQAARRELLEETGYTAEAFRPLLEASPEPHRSTARAHFFVAQGARFSGEAHPEPTEVIRTVLVPLAELLEDAVSGRIDHAAHVAALLVAERRKLLGQSAEPVLTRTTMTPYRVLYVTAPNQEEARSIAQTVVRERLAACANLLGDIESYYHWDGKFETGAEVALILKTTADRESALIERVKALHSYSCPAIVSLPIGAGHPPFLDWIAAETREGP